MRSDEQHALTKFNIPRDWSAESVQKMDQLNGHLQGQGNLIYPKHQSRHRLIEKCVDSSVSSEIRNSEVPSGQARRKMRRYQGLYRWQPSGSSYKIQVTFSVNWSAVIP